MFRDEGIFIKKNTIIRPYNEEFLKTNIEKKQIILILNKMIANWNNFRDKDIELNGDLSFSPSNKLLLNKLILSVSIFLIFCSNNLNNFLFSSTTYSSLHSELIRAEK